MAKTNHRGVILAGQPSLPPEIIENVLAQSIFSEEAVLMSSTCHWLRAAFVQECKRLVSVEMQVCSDDGRREEQRILRPYLGHTWGENEVAHDQVPRTTIPRRMFHFAFLEYGNEWNPFLWNFLIHGARPCRNTTDDETTSRRWEWDDDEPFPNVDHCGELVFRDTETDNKKKGERDAFPMLPFRPQDSNPFFVACYWWFKVGFEEEDEDDNSLDSDDDQNSPLVKWHHFIFSVVVWSRNGTGQRCPEYSGFLSFVRCLATHTDAATVGSSKGMKRALEMLAAACYLDRTVENFDSHDREFILWCSEVIDTTVFDYDVLIYRYSSVPEDAIRRHSSQDPSDRDKEEALRKYRHCIVLSVLQELVDILEGEARYFHLLIYDEWEVEQV